MMRTRALGSDENCLTILARVSTGVSPQIARDLTPYSWRTWEDIRLSSTVALERDLHFEGVVSVKGIPDKSGFSSSVEP